MLNQIVSSLPVLIYTHFILLENSTVTAMFGEEFDASTSFCPLIGSDLQPYDANGDGYDDLTCHTSTGIITISESHIVEQRRGSSGDRSTDRGSESQGVGEENRNQQTTSVEPTIAEVNVEQTTAGGNLDQTMAGNNLEQTTAGDNLDQSTEGVYVEQTTAGVNVEQTTAGEGEEGTTEPQKGTATNIIVKATEVIYRQ